MKNPWRYAIDKGAKPIRLALLLGLLGGALLSHAAAIAFYGLAYYSPEVQTCISRVQVDADEGEFY